MIDHRNHTATGHRHPKLRPHRILAAAAVCLAMTACESSASPRSPDHRASSEPAPPATSPTTAPGTTTIPQPARTFKVNQRPCDIVAQPTIVNVLGPDSGNLTPPRTETHGGITFVTCNRIYGNPGGSRTFLSLRLQLADPVAIKAEYEGLRRVTAKHFTLTDVTGLGQGAYTYTDPDIGENLAAYDGNLYLTLAVNPVLGPAKPTTQVLPMMIESAKAAMTKLSQ